MPDRIFQLLLIEDSQAEVRLFKEVLRVWHTRHCLYVADDGEEALDLLHKRGNYDGAPTPDLVFLDLNLPKMDGFQILRSIREDDDAKIQGIPVIVFTSSSAAEEIEKAYELGANSFITKPSDLGEYFRVLEGIEKFWFAVASVPPPSLPPICEANVPQ